MARIFNVSTVLRQVPKTTLGRFFEQLKIPFPHIDWHVLGEYNIAPILSVLEQLPRADLNEVERELRAIFDMACDSGINALIEAGKVQGNPDLAHRLPFDQTLYGKAMWVWLHHRDYFEHAELVRQVEHLAWWRKRSDLPCLIPRQSRDDLDRLRGDISRLLVAEQGRGRLCSAEMIVRDSTYFYFLYPDDFMQSVTEHDDHGNLAPRAIRRTFNIVLAYDAVGGTLELFAKVPSKLKPRLEEIFAQVILGVNLETWQATAAYRLNHLLHRTTQLPVDPKDGVSVTIRRLCCEISGSERYLELGADKNRDPRDIYDMMDEYLNWNNLPLSDLRVKSVTLEFVFEARPHRPAGSASIKIGYPGSCNLRHQKPERVEIIRKYLQLWGIDVRSSHTRAAKPTHHDPAAVA